jgi:hypothetical protein
MQFQPSWPQPKDIESLLNKMELSFGLLKKVELGLGPSVKPQPLKEPQDPSEGSVLTDLQQLNICNSNKPQET